MKAIRDVIATAPSGDWSLGEIDVVCSGLTISYVMPLPAAWAVACSPMRLGKSRPPRHRLFRQPGTTASVVATIVIGPSIATGFGLGMLFEAADIIQLF